MSNTSRDVAKSVRWFVLGLVAALAVGGELPHGIFLLVPVVVIGAFWAWQGNPGREFFGWIAGLALLPVLIGARPPACPASALGCPPSAPIWPWLLGSAGLVALSLLLITGGGRKSKPLL